MGWRAFDLDDLPPRNARMRLSADPAKTGFFAGTEARFLYVADKLRDRGHDLGGPWVIGLVDGLSRPLVYMPTAWEWFDETESERVAP